MTLEPARARSGAAVLTPPCDTRNGQRPARRPQRPDRCRVRDPPRRGPARLRTLAG